jgi:hypothetical protein
MNGLLFKHLHINHRPQKWAHDYRSVLPYVRNAFDQALSELESDLPEPVRARVREILRWLCDPDPKRRGHPTDLDRSQFSLERIVSAFDLFATKPEYGLRMP